ncbi:suppressor of npr1-1 [Spatholobus suberectus]|nr:suppressor of npr1-1 [Spatholobus suberectus]
MLGGGGKSSTRLGQSSCSCPPRMSLASLKELNLRASKKLTNLPDLSLAPNLETIDVSHCTSLLHVPLSIQCVKKLLLFNLESCKSLKSLPRNIHLSSLEMFILRRCSSLDESLEIVQSSKTVLIEDKYAFYYNCINLDQNSRNNIIADAPFEAAFTSLQEGTPLGPLFSICLPGTEIPDWFDYQSTNSSLDMEIPQQWFIDSKFLGFALCLVIGGFQQNSYEGYDPDVNCYHFVKSALNSDPSVPFLGHCTTVMQVPRGFNSDHIFICYYPAFNASILQDFKDLGLYYDANNLRLKVIFKFKGPSQRLDIVKKCGVRPLLIANSERLHIESELQPDEKGV